MPDLSSTQEPPVESALETENQFEQTRRFWNASPCDGKTDLESRRSWRYAKYPWLSALIIDIASRHGDIVEIGCGQGTDGITFCQNLPAGGRYRGIDYSGESVASAKQAVTEATDLKVTPELAAGNAEKLDFETNSVECVFSMGVLHHSPDTEKAVQEVFRILKPGGRAYILLYNRSSPKVLAAHFFRGIQSALDFVFRTDRIFYKAFYGKHFEGVLGTALLEGFGVPVLRSYTHTGIKRLFRDFKTVSLVRCGINLPAGIAGDQSGDIRDRALGLLFLAVVEKP